MKKLFMLLAIAGIFAACNAPAEKKTEKECEKAEAATEQVEEVAQDSTEVAEEAPAE